MVPPEDPTNGAGSSEEVVMFVEVNTDEPATGEKLPVVATMAKPESTLDA